MPWQIQCRRKEVGRHWEPITVERAKIVAERPERQYHYDTLNEIKIAFASFVEQEGSLPNLIVRLATGRPKFTDLYDIRFAWISEPAIAWGPPNSPEPKRSPAEPKQSPAAGPTGFWESERRGTPDIDRLREQVVRGRGQLDRDAEIKRLQGELDAANQHVKILESSRREAIASCLRACADSIIENRMEWGQAGQYLESYAATVLQQG